MWDRAMPCLRPEPARRYTPTTRKGELRPHAPNLVSNIVLTRLGRAISRQAHEEKGLLPGWLRFCESRVPSPDPGAGIQCGHRIPLLPPKQERETREAIRRALELS